MLLQISNKTSTKLQLERFALTGGIKILNTDKELVRRKLHHYFINTFKKTHLI